MGTGVRTGDKSAASCLVDVGVVAAAAVAACCCYCCSDYSQGGEYDYWVTQQTYSCADWSECSVRPASSRSLCGRAFYGFPRVVGVRGEFETARCSTGT